MLESVALFVADSTNFFALISVVYIAQATCPLQCVQPSVQQCVFNRLHLLWMCFHFVYIRLGFIVEVASLDRLHLIGSISIAMSVYECRMASVGANQIWQSQWFLFFFFLIKYIYNQKIMKILRMRLLNSIWIFDLKAVRCFYVSFLTLFSRSAEKGLSIYTGYMHNWKHLQKIFLIVSKAGILRLKVTHKKTIQWMHRNLISNGFFSQFNSRGFRLRMSLSPVLSGD